MLLLLLFMLFMFLFLFLLMLSVILFRVSFFNFISSIYFFNLSILSLLIRDLILDFPISDYNIVMNHKDKKYLIKIYYL